MTKDKKGTKIGLLVGISIIFILISIIMLVVNGTNKINKNKIILTYSEMSDINYKVYYNQDSDIKYLDENNEYNSSLIDNIVAEYNYSFLADDRLNVNYNYSIDSIVEIKNDGKVIDTKKYSIIPNNSNEKNKTTGFKISEVIDIKYNTYVNDIIENGYNPDYEYTLKVILNTRSSSYLGIKNIEKNSETLLIIPLFKENFRISKDVVKNYDEIDGNVEVLVKNRNMLVCGVILGGIGVLLLMGILIILSANPDMTISYKSEYKKIRKMVKEYDELIKRTYKMPSIKDKNVKELKSCEELIAIRDKYDLPMTMVEKETTVTFVVINNSKAWTYTIEKLDK